MLKFLSFQLRVQNLGLLISFIDFYLLLTRKWGDTKIDFINFEKTLFQIGNTHQDVQRQTFLRLFDNLVEKTLCFQDIEARSVIFSEKNKVGAIILTITYKLKHQDLSVSKKSCLYQLYQVACKKQKNSVGKILRKSPKPAKFRLFFDFLTFDTKNK